MHETTVVTIKEEHLARACKSCRFAAEPDQKINVLLLDGCGLHVVYSIAHPTMHPEVWAPVAHGNSYESLHLFSYS
jgi:hypothetical protein